MKTMKEVLAKAEQFIYSHARLLDRKRYAYHFGQGTADEVLEALRPYQNADGGFGSALEPDIRTSASQPVATELALHVMDEMGAFDLQMLQGVRLYLQNTVIPGTGGWPLATRSIFEGPRAPWWNIEDDASPSLNPSGQLLALLYKQQTDPSFYKEQWFQQSDAFVRGKLLEANREDYHDVIQCIAFVRHAPQDARTQQMEQQLLDWLVSDELVERDPYKSGYRHTILDWFPSPDSFGASLVQKEQLTAHLDALVAQQQEDGGWPLPWEAISPACLNEWRGMRAVDNLRVLKAYGRL